MAHTKINTQVIPDGTIVSADLTMPITGFSSTGIDDNATSTALTINSSRDVAISGNLTAGNNTDISMGASAPGQLKIDGVGYGGAIALDSTGMYIYHNSGSRSLLFGTNETERMRINSVGQVIIGEDASSVTNGLLKVRSDSNNHAISLIEPSGGSENWSLGLDSGGSLLFNNSGNADWTLALQDSGGMVFRDAGTDTLGLEFGQLAHNTASNLGVGIAFSRITSSSTLSAIGISSTSKLTLFSREGVGFFTGGNSGYGATAETMRIDSAGRVLINQTSTDESLNLEVMAPPSFSVGSGFHSGSTQSTISFKDTNTTADYKVRIGSEGDELLLFAGGSARVRIDDTGNVGIGTTTPSRELQIKLADDTTTTLGQKGGIGLYAPSNTVGNGGEIIWSSGSNSEVWAAISGHIQANSAGVATGHLIFATANAAALPTERMRIDATGNVGIGTDDPWNLLTLKGGTYPTIALGENSTEMVYLQRNQVNGGDGFLYNKGSGALIFGTNNQRRITVTGTSGNVGIGTSTPRSRLDLGNDSSGGTQISWHSSSTRSLGNIWTSNNGGRLTLAQALKGSNTSANGFLASYTGTWAPSAIEVSYGAINIYTNPAQALTYGAGFTATRRAQFTNGTFKLENTPTSSFVLNIDDGAFAGRQALLPGRFVIGPPGNGYPDIGYNFKNGGTSAQTYYSSDTAWKQSFGTGSKMTFSHAVSGTTGNTISWNEVMHIHADNQVSIGKSTAQARLHVQGGDDWTQILENSQTGGIPWYIGSTANNWSAGGSKFVITSNPTSSAADFAIDSSGNAAFPLGGSAIASDAVTEAGVVLQVQGPIASGISQGYYNNTPPRHIANWFCYSTASNAGAGYIHMKTNLWAGGSPNGNIDYTMSLFTFRGYAYTGSNGVAMGMTGFHNWTGTLYNQNVHNDTSWLIARSAYVSSDGYVVLVGYVPASYSFIYVDWNQWGGYDFRNRKVTASSHSSNATGVY